MLLELDVRDFAIIDHLHVRVAPGFNVLTGETGAGKSIVVDAVGQLLGDRADVELVRAGSERALIEGIFDAGPVADRIAPLLAEYGIDAEPELILRREIHSAGRSTARVNGRAVPVRALAELGALLVDIHGQSENVSLKRESEHVELLDRYAGLEPEREELARVVSRVRAVAAEQASLQRDDAALARRAELLVYEVEEIEAARLSAQEESELLAERVRLANAERLATLADGAYTALRGGEGDQLAALDLVSMALESLERLIQIDPTLKQQVNEVAESVEALGEVATRLLDYRDRLDFSPDRLEEVEDRLGVIANLKRKYGGDIPAVLAYAQRASAELADLTSAEERIRALSAEHERLLADVGRLAVAMSVRRRAAGEQMARAVELELEALGMPGSRFEVAMTHRPDPAGVPVDVEGGMGVAAKITAAEAAAAADAARAVARGAAVDVAGDAVTGDDAVTGTGTSTSTVTGHGRGSGERLAFDATGIDRVAFLVSTNPGEPPRPLVRVASGGETSRLMLALKSILTAADRTPTLIFDEIDAGIGGRVGAVVGEKLWRLGERHQVLCVTHLPQVAVFADTHFRVQKAVANERTTADVAAIVEDERVAELTLMLGSPTDVARQNAVQLLQQSERWKVTQAAPKHGRGP